MKIQERITVPTEMSEISLTNFLRFQKRAEGQNEGRVMQLAMQYFCHVTEEAVYTMEVDDVMEISAMIAEVVTGKVPVLQGDETIEISGVTYQFVGDKKWSFGEFIELTTVAEGEEIDAEKLIRTVWRPVDSKGNAVKFTAQESNIQHFPLDWGLATMNFFNNAFTSLSEEFPELFGGEGGSSMDFSMEAGFSQKWGWLGKIDTLANGDITKYEAVEETYFKTCFIKLIFDSEKQDLINRKIKQQQEMHHG
jgi:hypothetical protein